MPTRRWHLSSTSARLGLASLALVGLGSLIWWGTRPNAPREHGSAAAVRTTPLAAGPERSALPELDRRPSGLGSTARDDSVETRLAEEPAGVAVRPSARSATHTLFLEVRQPDGTPPEGFRGRLTLERGDGAVRRFDLDSGGFLERGGFDADLWTSSVEAEGFSHAPQTFDFRPLGRTSTARLVDTLYVWPKDSVAVLLDVQPGAGLAALSDGDRASRAEQARQALQLRVTSVVPPVPRADLESEDGLAYFRRAPASRPASDSTIGLFERRAVRSLWLGLEYQGEVLSWLPLSIAQPQVRFELEATDFAQGSASLRVRLEHQGSSEPVVDARLTLERVGIPARLVDPLPQPRLEADGAWWSRGLWPGWYALELEAGPISDSTSVHLHAGEQLDLGTIALPSGPRTVQVLAVDERGRPIEATVTVVPLQQGLTSGPAFPSHGGAVRTRDLGLVSIDSVAPQRITRADGQPVELVLPLRRSLVRAMAVPKFEEPSPAGPQTTDWRAEAQQWGELPSIDWFGEGKPELVGIFELDPEGPPDSPWRLVLRAPRMVILHVGDTSGSIEVLNENGSSVQSARLPSTSKAIGLRLPQGKYSWRHRDETGAVVAERTFELGATDLELDL